MKCKICIPQAGRICTPARLDAEISLLPEKEICTPARMQKMLPGLSAKFAFWADAFQSAEFAFWPECKECTPVVILIL
jgi:hypothetical protein